MRKLLTVEGMSCGHCAAHVREALSGVAGVKVAEVDLIKKLATVDGEDMSNSALQAAVVEAGYTISAIL
jgi:copper chaperone CopZ